MKIYIAGKIAGDRRYRAKFREAAKVLEAAGHVVLNPATLPDGLTDGDYMRICMAMVDTADLAVFLPDYQESRGAMVEWAYCQRIGKDCAMYLDRTEGEHSERLCGGIQRGPRKSVGIHGSQAGRMGGAGEKDAGKPRDPGSAPGGCGHGGRTGDGRLCKGNLLNLDDEPAGVHGATGGRRA